ncbi:MAG: O-antigen ligase family protein [Novosphingobium sp.]|uniref:O-antigen ligase family protein n=1 Tax=Novosphingobium sp. TaxID=1874826 RepID=UPI003B9DA1ED
MHKNLSIMLLAIVTAACLLGGGGVAYGLSNLAVQLIAIAVLALNGELVARFVTQGSRFLVALVILTLALPLLQLVPLPPAFWMGLPGRELVTEAIKSFGEPGWRPLTVNTSRTFVAFLGLIAPLAVLVAGLFASVQVRQRIAFTFVAAGVASVLLGVVQVMGNNQEGLLYPENPLPGVLFGFFANRNSVAIFLVSCLLLLIGCFAPQRALSPRWIARFAVAVLIVTGVVLTQSRSGIALLTLPAALFLLKTYAYTSANSGIRQSNTGALPRPLQIGVIAAAMAALSLGAVAAVPGSRLEAVMARFEQDGERRPEIWEDARFSAERFWPVGAGMGTFDEVFQVDESLEHISARRAGRAHNEVLELAIEAGPIALILVAAWAMWVLHAGWGALRDTERRWPALAGIGVLLAAALQSLLEFPLRNQAMLCVAAFSIVLIAPPIGMRKTAATPSRRDGDQAA